MLDFQRNIQNISKYLNKIDKHIQSYILLFFVKNPEILADQNRKQLLEGKSYDESVITPLYKPITVKIKQRRSQPYKNKQGQIAVTLKATGKFHKDIKQKVTPNGFELFNRNALMGKLQNKYGDKLIGISDAMIYDIAQDEITLFVIKQINKDLAKYVY